MQLCPILPVIMGYTRKLHCKATDGSHSEQERTNAAQPPQPFAPLPQPQGFHFGLLGKVPRSNTAPTAPKLEFIFSRGWTRLSPGPRGRKTSAETEPVATAAAGTGAAPRPPPHRRGAGQSPRPARRQREARGGRQCHHAGPGPERRRSPGPGSRPTGAGARGRTWLRPGGSRVALAPRSPALAPLVPPRAPGRRRRRLTAQVQTPRREGPALPSSAPWRREARAAASANRVSSCRPPGDM